MKQCRDCKWWDYEDQDHVNSGYSWGQCHRLPPLPYDSKDRDDAIWPPTYESDWCGEFEQK